MNQAHPWMLLSLALFVSACSTSQLPELASTEASKSTFTVFSSGTVPPSASLIERENGLGSQYRLYRPASRNEDFVIYAHDYLNPRVKAGSHEVLTADREEINSLFPNTEFDTDRAGGELAALAAEAECLNTEIAVVQARFDFGELEVWEASEQMEPLEQKLAWLNREIADIQQRGLAYGTTVLVGTVARSGASEFFAQHTVRSGHCTFTA